MVITDLFHIIYLNFEQNIYIRIFWYTLNVRFFYFLNIDINLIYLNHS